MVSLEIAKQLKAAGLLWQPVMHDFFAIPDRGLDHERFVISDMTVYVELLRGWPIATFHGTSEWALDYIYLQELVWMPSEAQIREALELQLAGESQPAVHLFGANEAHRCEINLQGQTLAFTADEASDAYASALLYVLQYAPGLNGQLS
jgi:hypothetical protein